MSRTPRTKFAIGAVLALLVVAVAGFAAINLWLSSDDAPDAFAASEDLQPTNASDIPSGEWFARPTETEPPDDDLGAGYRILEDVPVGGPEEVAGRTRQVEASLTLGDGQLESVTVTLDVASLDSGNSLRDRIVADDYLDAPTFPTARFELSEPVPIDAGADPAGPVPLTFPGELTIQGVSRPVNVEASAQWTDEEIEVVGTTDITLDSFDVDRPDLAGRTARNEATVEFKLSLAPAP